MGAVVGAGKLVGLTPEEMVHAIGITVGGNTATRQGRADTLSNWKAYAAADACRKAIFSVQLAGNGMTGPSNVFEGRYGFFKVMSRKPVAPPQHGEPFGIRRCFTKRFPLGQFSQTVAQAAATLSRVLRLSRSTIRHARTGIGNPASSVSAAAERIRISSARGSTPKAELWRMRTAVWSSGSFTCPPMPTDLPAARRGAQTSCPIAGSSTRHETWTFRNRSGFITRGAICFSPASLCVEEFIGTMVIG